MRLREESIHNRFAYNGYTVTVDSTGDVDLENRVAALDPEKTAV